VSERERIDRRLYFLLLVTQQVLKTYENFKVRWSCLQFDCLRLRFAVLLSVRFTRHPVQDLEFVLWGLEKDRPWSARYSFAGIQGDRCDNIFRA